MTRPNAIRPKIVVTYNETAKGIVLWILTTRSDVPPQPLPLGADQAHVLLGGLRAAIDGKTELRTVTGEQWPRLGVTYDETTSAVALWLQPRPDGPRGPILCTADDARDIIDAVQRAVDDRDRLRGELDAIHESDPDDFR